MVRVGLVWFCGNFIKQSGFNELIIPRGAVWVLPCRNVVNGPSGCNSALCCSRWLSASRGGEGEVWQQLYHPGEWPGPVPSNCQGLNVGLIPFLPTLCRELSLWTILLNASAITSLTAWTATRAGRTWQWVSHFHTWGRWRGCLGWAEIQLKSRNWTDLSLGLAVSCY